MTTRDRRTLLDLLGLNRIFQAGAEIKPTRKVLNFLGAVTVEDDPLNDRTNITIGSGGSGSLTPEAVLAALVGQEIKSLTNPSLPQSAATRAFVEARDAAVLTSANAYTDAQLAAYDISSKADKARQMIAGAGLTGGGDLSADRTLNVVAADGSISVTADAIAVGVVSDAQHGNRGGGGLHQLATTSVHGFLASSDKAAYDAAVLAVATKADQTYVDQLVQGLDAKGSVDAVATSNITLSGLQTVDSKALTAGMLCLAAGQTDGTQNGPYTVSASGWTRAPNANTSAKVTAGLYVWTSNGANKGGWLLTTPDPITLGTTALTFERYEIGLSNAVPQMNGTANAGSDALASRGGHVHPIDTSRAAAARTIAAGAGLTGGGDLTADRTLNVVAGDASIAVSADAIAVGVISDAQHGTRGGGTTHALATSTAHGFQSNTDKQRLDIIFAQQTQAKTITKSVDILSGPTGGWSIYQLSGSTPYRPRKVPSGASINAPPTASDVYGQAYFIELNDALPDGSAYITGFKVRVFSDPGAGASAMPPTKMQLTLSEYDGFGLRSQRAYVLDPSANRTAYEAIHEITWSGSIAINPKYRYVAELTSDDGWATSAASSYLVSAEMTCECYSVADAFVQAMAPHTRLRADNPANTTSGTSTTVLANMAAGATDTFAITGTVGLASSDASLSAQKSLTVSGTQRAVSSRPAADWSFLHSGSGSDVFHVFVPTSLSSASVLHSTDGGGTANSAQFFYTNTGLLYSWVYAGGSLLGTNTASGSVAAGIATSRETSYSSLDGLALSTNAGGDSQGAFTPFTPSAGAPQTTLSLWATNAGGAAASLRWAETIIFNRVLTALERQLVREYIQLRYGIAAPALTAAHKRILARAPKSFVCGDSPVTLASGNVSEIHDLARHGAKYTQATGANQVPAPASVAGLYNGRNVFTSATASKGYQSNLPAAEWAFEHNGNGMDSWFLGRSTSTSGTRCLKNTVTSSGAGYQIQSGSGSTALDLARILNASTVTTGQWTSRSYTANVPFVARYKNGSAQSPNMATKITGVAEATSNFTLAVASAAPQHSLVLLNTNGFSAGWLGDMAASLEFDRALTAQEATDTYADLQELYGVAA